jgi:pyridoxal 5'-phosphate synthase pdxT subunit
MKTVGILNLQGCVDPHADHLRSLGVDVRFVTAPRDLERLHGLILPGGESTTMLKLAKEVTGLWEPLRSKAKEIPFWGVCAGSILMASEVENPAQDCLGIMNLCVRRNAYGSQIHSFQDKIALAHGVENSPAVFIRAPKFVSWGPEVQVAGTVNSEAVYLEEGKHMVTAFHPELTNSAWCHARFLARL